jgi:hypothetical protein
MSTAVARGPGRESLLWSRTGPGRGRAMPRARMSDRVSRQRSAAYQRTRPREPRSISSRRRRARGARRFDRTDLWSRPHLRDRSQPHARDRRRRCWQPSMHRSVRGFAPSGQSGRSEEISATAGASMNPPSQTLPTNHAESLKSRLGSRRSAATRAGTLWGRDHSGAMESGDHRGRGRGLHFPALFRSCSCTGVKFTWLGCNPGW